MFNKWVQNLTISMLLLARARRFYCLMCTNYQYSLILILIIADAITKRNQKCLLLLINEIEQDDKQNIILSNSQYQVHEKQYINKIWKYIWNKNYAIKRKHIQQIDIGIKKDMIYTCSKWKIIKHKTKNFIVFQILTSTNFDFT